MTRVKHIVLILALSVGLSAIGSVGLARIYKYVDEQGTVVFVDDETKIPPQYKDQLKTYEQPHDKLSPEARTKYFEEKQRREEQLEAEEQRALELAEKRKRASTQVTKVEMIGNHVIVPVEVAYQNHRAQLKLMLDTGASNTTIYFAPLLKFEFTKGELGFIQVAGGYYIPKVRVELLYFKVGPFTERGMSIDIIDNVASNTPYDGLLGMDFLSQHSFVVDPDKQEIHWQ